MTVETLSRTQKLRLSALSSIIAMVVFIIGLLWIKLHQEANKQQENFQFLTLVSAKSDAIERQLTSALMATRMLDVQIRMNNGSREGFNQYARNILDSVPGVSNIQLAPKGIITDIYPLSGNEKAIGHDILKDDRRRDEARRAVSTNKMTLAGPFKLIQGGVAVIGRQPVFISSGQQESFWGFASALIHLDSLLAVANFKELEQQGYAFELSYEEIGTGKTKVIEQSGAPLGEFWHQEYIEVPNNVWTLKIGHPASQMAENLYLPSLLLAFLSIVVFALCFHILKQPEYLRVQVRNLRQQINKQAMTDALTQLPNRQQFYNSIQAFYAELGQKPTASALLFIDLDNFHSINETLGQTNGDQLLCKVAERLKAITRESDLSARIGSDEFAILIKEVRGRNDAILVAEKVLSRLGSPVPGIGDGVDLSVSIGILMIPDDCSNFNDIFINAGVALRQAKNTGKNRYCFYQKKTRSTVNNSQEV